MLVKYGVLLREVESHNAPNYSVTVFNSLEGFLRAIQHETFTVNDMFLNHRLLLEYEDGRRGNLSLLENITVIYRNWILRLSESGSIQVVSGDEENFRGLERMEDRGETDELGTSSVVVQVNQFLMELLNFDEDYELPEYLDDDYFESKEKTPIRTEVEVYENRIVRVYSDV